MELKEAASAKLDQLRGSGWVVMYPSYIDSSMSVKDGRKVRAEYACMFRTFSSDRCRRKSKGRRGREGLQRIRPRLSC